MKRLTHLSFAGAISSWSLPARAFIASGLLAMVLKRSNLSHHLLGGGFVIVFQFGGDLFEQRLLFFRNLAP